MSCYECLNKPEDSDRLDAILEAVEPRFRRSFCVSLNGTLSQRLLQNHVMRHRGRVPPTPWASRRQALSTSAQPPSHPPTTLRAMPAALISPSPSSGLKPYYQAKIEAAELEINQKTQNLRRLEAQRNALNARG